MRWAALLLLAFLIAGCGTAAPPASITTASGAVPLPPGVTTGRAALKGSSVVDASRACVASLRP